MPTPIIEPVPREALEHELTPQHLARCFRGAEIYVVDAHGAPAVMDEIGRIREVEFRAEGGGTDKNRDIDEFDTGDPPFRQIVAWDPVNREIIGLYRFAWASGTPLPTARLFEFSHRFESEYLPATVELGRSVVNRSAKRAIMGLFVAWAGLGALIRECPQVKYFFGKFTLYPSYHARARGALQRFLDLYCRGDKTLVRPRSQLAIEPASEFEDGDELQFAGGDYEADYDRLMAVVKGCNESLPPLFISYLGLSRDVMTFGTARNSHFGDVLETAIMVPVDSINEKQKRRFVESHSPGPNRLFCT